MWPDCRPEISASLVVACEQPPDKKSHGGDNSPNAEAEKALKVFQDENWPNQLVSSATKATTPGGHFFDTADRYGVLILSCILK